MRDSRCGQENARARGAPAAETGETRNGNVERYKQRIVLPDDTALHCRTAAKVVQLVQDYEATVTVTHNKRHVDARSALGLLSLGITSGGTVELAAEGKDADIALRSVAHILKRSQAEMGNWARSEA